ncbi:hypothetical protein diail_3745 [Diaporthe ilicicola]|nr:hypothetical protein diail_3745 [Diaporthe ilicicola]
MQKLWMRSQESSTHHKTTPFQSKGSNSSSTLLVSEGGRGGEAHNASAETDVTMRELQGAIAEAVIVPAVDVSREDALARMRPFLVNFLLSENRGSNKKAVSGLGWQPKEAGVLDEIRNGSYVDLAEPLGKGE